MKKQMSIHLDTELIREIKYKSISIDLNVSEYLTKIIREDLNNDKSLRT
jgi:hypothetical protein